MVPYSPDAGRYVNPYTDFGFKLLFGTEDNKEVLITFLNALLHLDSPIEDIQYLNGEQFGDTAYNRKAIFDVYCQSEDGSHFIVEMQKAEQNYFIDRSVFYASFPIRNQAPRCKDWDFRLTPVYAIGILDFVFDNKNPEHYVHEAKISDIKTHDVLYEKLTFVYIEMKKFNKQLDECETLLDKMLFVLKNMVCLFDRPKELQERVFERIFHAAEIAKFTPMQQQEYENSVKVYRDLKNVTDTAFGKGEAKGFAKGVEQGIEIGKEQGLQQGIQQGIHTQALNTARVLKNMGLTNAAIADATGLSIDDIAAL